MYIHSIYLLNEDLLMSLDLGLSTQQKRNTNKQS